MRVNFNIINYPSSNIYNKQKNKQFKNNLANQTKFDIPFYKPTFKGNSVAKLYEEYNWYINCDKTPAIEAFLKMNYPQKVMEDFLSKILETKDRSYQFIESITFNPRKVQHYYKSLNEKVENLSNVKNYNPTCLYNNAYINFITNKYENAHTLSEMLRIRPDWSEDALLKKHQKLRGNSPLEIGNIPKEFSHNDLSTIYEYLKNQMQIGLKTEKKILPLSIGYKTYEFVFFTEGKSDKNVFGVFTPEGKKFVFKIGTQNSKSLSAPFALGTLAKIDTYLTTNRCRNSAPLCYYNHDKNLSIYKYITHTPANGDTQDLYTISSHLPDFESLGLKYNDSVGYKNCFLLNELSNEDLYNSEGFSEGVKAQEWISVDNDHVTYSNTFQPLITGLHSYLPNGMQMFF